MVSWTAMTMGCALQGHAYDAISLFEQTKGEAIKPTYVAFMAALTACSHAGLVDEAWKYYNSMTKKYRIALGIEHYAYDAISLFEQTKGDKEICDYEYFCISQERGYKPYMYNYCPHI
ncbi:putative pentatricopeptide [Rosa chinensis]|uniref:Putative pentatricopeptide n=1 Tax=Rosa chinensis TaxID=74649 RepID=A0A2P6Q9V4_ROSCH|nr:putative pentatricopeptide [Rosa chinensis]